MSTQALTISYDQRVKTFWTFVFIALFSLACYVYAINATTRHIAARQDLEREISKLTTNVGTLEFTYIEARNKIDLDVARAYGYEEVTEPIYVSRTLAHSLTLARVSDSNNN